MSRVLVVDDEKSIRMTLGAFLEDEGYEVATASHYEEAVRLFSDGEVDVVVTDIVLGGKSGVDLLASLREQNADCPVIMITGYPSLDTAAQSIRLGAFDYLQKPVLKKPLVALTKRAVDEHQRRKVSKRHQVESLRYRTHLEERLLEQSIDIRKAESELQISERRYQSLVDTLPEIILELDTDSHVRWMNRVGLDFFGDSLLACNLLSTVSRELDRQELVGSLKPLLDGAKPLVHCKAVHQRVDGESRFMSWTFKAVSDVEGRSPLILATGRDISEIRRLEEQLRQASKLETIGLLAGGIAHDFNNILGAIVAQAELIRTRADDLPATLEGAVFIERAVKRAEALTSKLLGFARGGQSINAPFDVHVVVDEALELLKRTIERNITLSFNPGAECATVLGDATQFHQVILNLVLNARDALRTDPNAVSSPSRGGTIAVSTKHVTLANDSKQNRVDVPAGQYLLIAVKDSGCGIPENLRKLIFEPFFTTKDYGKGTGMGLAMVYGIVRAHGGFIELDSQVGAGTEFRVYVPLCTQAPIEKLNKPCEKLVLGQGRILLLDDDDLVRTSFGQLLEHLGYSVTCCARPSEALEAFRVAPQDFDVVILDMMLPEMTSRDCLSALQETRPDIKVILSSGFGLNAQAQEMIAAGAAAMIQKPFHLAQLSELIAKVLER